MIKATVNGDDVRRAIEDMKAIDPKLYTALRTNLRKGLTSPAAAVENGWPQSSALPRGMARSISRMAYERPDVKVSFTPGVTRRGISSLLSLVAKMPKDAAGAWIGEMAGIRGNYRSGLSKPYKKTFVSGEMQHRLNGQGQALVVALNNKFGKADKGGRWGWRKFHNMKSNVRNIGENILNDAVDQLNREGR